MGKLWSYTEHTLSIVNTSETFPNVAFVAVVVGFFVLRNALLPTRSFLFLVCDSECGKEVRTALAGQSLWGFCLSVISCVTQTTETRSNKNFTVQQTRMWPMYATWCVLFVTGHTWKLPRGFFAIQPHCRKQHFFLFEVPCGFLGKKWSISLGWGYKCRSRIQLDFAETQFLSASVVFLLFFRLWTLNVCGRTDSHKVKQSNRGCFSLRAF